MAPGPALPCADHLPSAAQRGVIAVLVLLNDALHRGDGDVPDHVHARYPFLPVFTHFGTRNPGQEINILGNQM
jgi:hypothetical protein